VRWAGPLLACAVAVGVSCDASAGIGLGVGIGRTQPGAASPSVSPGFKFRFAPGGIVNTSGSVATVHDSGPLGCDLASSGAQRPVYVASALANYPGFRGVAATPSQIQSSCQLTWGKQATVHMVMEIESGPLGSMWETTNAAYQDNGIGFYTTNLTGALTIGNNDYGGWLLPFLAATYQVFTFRFDGTGTATGGSGYWGRNRMGWEPPLVTSNFATEAINAFAHHDGTFSQPTSGTIVDWVAYDGNPTEAMVQQNIDALSATYGLNTSLPTHLLFVQGDSISGGCMSLSTLAWNGHVVLDGAFPNLAFSSVAYPGKLLSTAYTEVALELAQRRPGLPWSAVNFIGTNDAGNSSTLTPAALYATLVNETSAEFAAGADHVAWITMLPRGGAFNGGQTVAGFETFREGAGGYNPLMRAGAATCCAKPVDVWDLGADSVMGGATAYNNATYFSQVDFTHPTNAGQSRIYSVYVAPGLTAYGY